MRKRNGPRISVGDLRNGAESQMAGSRESAAAFRSHAELPHEVRVRHVELGMQNENLRQARAALEQSRDRYADFYDLAPVGYLSLSAGGLITEINLTGAEMLGGERAGLLQCRFHRFIEAADIDDWQLRFTEALRKDARLTCEVGLRRPDGTRIDARLDCLRVAQDEAGTALRVVLTDITEQKTSQAALRAALHLKESILNAVPLAVIATTPDGTITGYNRVAERMLGYTADEMVGHRSVATLHDRQELADRARELASATATDPSPDFAVLVAKARRGEPNENQWTLVRKDGSRFPALVSSVALHDESGAVSGFLGIAMDISERRRSEDQLREMAASLEEKVSVRTRQMRALSAQLTMTAERERRLLAQDLHDDLGQLLAIVKIKLTSLAAGSLQPAVDQVVELVDKAELSVRSLAMQLSPPILRTLGFVPALEWLADEMERVYGIKVHIDHECCRRPLLGEVQAMLYRSVRELLINVARHARVADATLCCLCDTSHLRLVVSDDGCGFDPENIRDGLAGNGSFGLNSIRERITNIGGAVEVDSSPHNGSIITLTVPCTILECSHDPNSSCR